MPFGNDFTQLKAFLLNIQRLYNMTSLQSINNKMKRYTALLLCTLLLSISTLNWMAGGNFTTDEFAIVMGKAQNFDKSITDGAAFTQTAKAISDDLNNRWAEAWNVVIVSTPYNMDTVKYGYAYNQRWFWFNGIKMNNNRYVGLIIWKDWHCVGWMSINSQATVYKNSSDTTSGLADRISGQYFGETVNDIWGLASTYAAYLQGKNPSMGSDPWIYTVIFSQHDEPHHYSRVCVKNYYTSQYMNDKGGWALVLQMHDH